MFKYFDLNEQSSKSLSAPITTMKAGSQPAKETRTRLSRLQQTLLYLGLFIGVLFSSAVSQFQAGEAIGLKFDLTTLIISAIVALILVPVVYQKLQLNPKTPLLVQFGFFVQNGVFWQVIIDSLSKII